MLLLGLLMMGTPRVLWGDIMDEEVESRCFVSGVFILSHRILVGQMGDESSKLGGVGASDKRDGEGLVVCHLLALLVSAKRRIFGLGDLGGNQCEVRGDAAALLSQSHGPFT